MTKKDTEAPYSFQVVTEMRDIKKRVPDIRHVKKSPQSFPANPVMSDLSRFEALSKSPYVVTVKATAPALSDVCKLPCSRAFIKPACR